MSVVSLLDLDAELAAATGADGDAIHGTLIEVPRGRTPVVEDRSRDPAVWGFYVASGVMLRDLTLATAAPPELIGPGEIIEPVVEMDTVLPVRQRFAAVEPSRLLVLGVAAARAIAERPELLAVLQRRGAAQRLRATTLTAIAHLPSANTRILAVLWQLAEAWGRVSPVGTIIPFPLTHEALGCLIGARRPTVSVALAQMTRNGLVQRLDDGTWLLPQESLDVLHEQLAGAGPAPDQVLRARASRRRAEALMVDASRLRDDGRSAVSEASAVTQQAAQVRRRLQP